MDALHRSTSLRGMRLHTLEFSIYARVFVRTRSRREALTRPGDLPLRERVSPKEFQSLELDEGLRQEPGEG